MIIDKNSLKQAEQDGKKDPYIAYQVGEYYYTQKEYKTAVEWYTAAVTGKRKEPLALFALGYAYQFGQGVPVDLIQALHYYEAAASENVPQACYNLAFFYQNGLGVKKDLQKADYYAQRAAEALKHLSEALSEAKNIQIQFQSRYEEAIQSVVEKSNDWMQISQECARQKEEQVQLQAKIERLTEMLKNTHASILQYQKELAKKDSSYAQLLQVHKQALTAADTQNKKISQLDSEKEAAYRELSEKSSRCSALEEQVRQQDREINDLCHLQSESQDRQLELQKVIDLQQDQIKENGKELTSREIRLTEAQNRLEKWKIRKWIFFFLGILFTAALAGIAFYCQWIIFTPGW